MAPVSGIVTADGKPISDLKIVFYPKGSKENPAPGPFSTGQTDSEGKFTLVSRYGEPGAVVGLHRVGFEMPSNLDPAALGEAQGRLTEMLAEGEADPASAEAIKDEIVKIKKKMRGFAFVPARYLETPIIELDVPAEGIADHPVVLTAQ